MPFDPNTAIPLHSNFDPQSAQTVTPPATRAQKPGPWQNAADSVMAAIHGGVNDTLFGLPDKAAAKLYSTVHPDVSYDTALQAAHENDAAAKSNHPVASVVGDVAGMFTGGGLAADALKVAGKVPIAGRGITAAADWLAPTTGKGIATAAGNVAKSAAVGAGAGAADALARGGSADDAIAGGLLGAVANPVLTKGAQVAVKILKPATEKAMLLLAKKIDEHPDTLQAAFDGFKAATGRTPTMAELMGAKSQGALKELAAGNETVGDAMIRAQTQAGDARAASLPAQVEQVTGQGPQSISQLTQARKLRMDQSMDGLRDQTVTLDKNHMELLNNPAVREATGDPVLSPLRKRVNQAVQDIDKAGSSDALTINDVDTLRQALGSRQAAFSNPANASHNSQVAKAYGDVRDQVTDLVDPSTGPGKAYLSALTDFENDSHYVSGFKHGMAGKTHGEAEAPSLIKSLDTQHGQEGYNAGILTRMQNAAGDTRSGAVRAAGDMTEPGAQQVLSQAVGPKQASALSAAGHAEQKAASALDTIAPGTVRPDAEGSGLHGGQAVGAVLAHSPAGLAFHMARAMPGAFGKLSPQVQAKVAKYLADPQMTQQGINLLRKAGASAEDMKRLALMIGATGSGMVGSSAGPE